MGINREALRFFLLVAETRRAEGKIRDMGLEDVMGDIKDKLELETELDEYIRKKAGIIRQRPDVMEEIMGIMREKQHGR